MKAKYLARTGISMSALLLASCSGSGGDVSTSPPPPTTPTPTPSPAPTPAPSPTPTPTPSPTPAASANADLLGPLVSETFVNDAAIGTATFNNTGTRGTAANAAVTVSYDANSRSYSLSSASGAVTFSPNNIDTAQSTATALVYIRRSGAITDTLTVTRAGTSGPITYTYVGSAFWQRTELGNATGIGSLNATAYGAQTAASAVPRSGVGNYSVDLIGAATVSNNVAPLAGQGQTSVDFGNGTVVTTGSLIGPFTTRATTFSSAARIESSTRRFAGDFKFEDFGDFVGTVSGHFYGPAAQEIGASFAAVENSGRIAVGTFMGRQSASDVGNASFIYETAHQTLTNSQNFATVASRINYDLTGRAGENLTTGIFSATSARLEPTSVRFDAATNTYSLVAPDIGGSFRGASVTDNVDPGFYIARPSPLFDNRANYVRVGRWSESRLNGASTSYRDSFLAFGMVSPNSEIVRSGSAGFKIDVIGRAADSDYPNFTNISGRGDLFVDFATGQVRGLVPLNFVEAVRNSNPGTNRGDLTLTAALASNTNGFAGTASMTGLGSYSGSVQGQFFGPGAHDVGGAFSLSDGAGGVAAGGFAGVRDASVIDPVQNIPRLADLTSPTALTVVVDRNNQFSGNLVGVSYNPASRAYTISLQDTSTVGAPVRSATLDNSTEAVFGTTATFRAHSTSIDNSQALTAAILRPDAAQVILSYTSLGEFAIERRATTADPFDASRYFAVFGVSSVRVPSDGTATYSGIARGIADINDGNVSRLYSLSGSSTMSVDFARQSFSALLDNFVGVAMASSDRSSVAGIPPRSFNSLSYTGSIIGVTFASQGDSSHRFDGRFFGPAGAEVGAHFYHQQGTPYLPAGALTITGAMVGAKQP